MNGCSTPNVLEHNFEKDDDFILNLTDGLNNGDCHLSCDYLEEGEFQPNGCSTPIKFKTDVDTNDDIFKISCDGLVSTDCSFSSGDTSTIRSLQTGPFSGIHSFYIIEKRRYILLFYLI